MPLFDRYIAVDWSAKNSRTGGGKGQKDAIWISEVVRFAGSAKPLQSENPRTRREAMSHLESRLSHAISAGERVIVGFDFPFGYPEGAAKLLGAGASWDGLWSLLAARVTDGDDNTSNRFEIAAEFNRGIQPHGPVFWGHAGKIHPGLGGNKIGLDYSGTSEKRVAERVARSASPVWQLNGAGCVGGQAILGIARLEALRQSKVFGGEISIWPFETDFERDLSAPIVIAEIYPSLFHYDRTSFPPDRAQVEAVTRTFASYDDHGRLSDLLALPSDQAGHRASALREEGWIVGVSSERVKAKLAPIPDTPEPASGVAATRYLRDPGAIYAQSFATIEAEADLAQLPSELHPAAIRMIHACGMVDLTADIVGEPAVVTATRAALAAGAPVLCDCEMVRSGVIRRFLPEQTELLVTLNDPAVPDLAASLGTTRSAAAVELWRPRLAGAVVLIGNAPTALFHLIELIEAGGPRPAAIIAAPVGFVGAAESKALLASGSLSIPFLTVLGRRGGSAIASAAFNAISRVS